MGNSFIELKRDELEDFLRLLLELITFSKDNNMI